MKKGLPLGYYSTAFIAFNELDPTYINSLQAHNTSISNKSVVDQDVDFEAHYPKDDNIAQLNDSFRKNSLSSIVDDSSTTNIMH